MIGLFMILIQDSSVSETKCLKELVKSEFNMSSAVCWGSRGRLLGLPQTDLSDWTLSALWDQGDVTGHHWRNTANGVYASKVLQGRFKAPELQGTAAGFARPLWTSECRSSCCAPLCSQPKETTPLWVIPGQQFYRSASLLLLPQYTSALAYLMQSSQSPH